jgi:site-specific DNA-methyltransferase (adenine-specific)
MTRDPYYSDDHVTLYHGDCREVTEWLDADVLVTDPPYGIGWDNVALTNRTLRGYTRSAKLRHEGIAGDEDTSMRDRALEMWDHGPALVFGSPRIAPPSGTKHALTWRKPLDAGVIGSALPWRRDTEAIYVLGSWPKSTGTSSSVIDGPRGMRSYVDGTHPHVKPLAVLEQLIAATPPGITADPFAGSGSTLVAAKRLGRKAIGVEIEEKYCEIAAKRLAQEVLEFGTAS